MANRQRGDEAQLDELGNDPGQVGSDSAGQSGDGQQLSSIADAADQSVQELADTDQAIEAGIVEGIEDAANHPERPVHTHLEYGHPDDLPANPESDEADGLAVIAPRLGTRGEEINVEDLSTEDVASEYPTSEDVTGDVTLEEGLLDDNDDDLLNKKVA
jgi:hypothetical protein